MGIESSIPANDNQLEAANKNVPEALLMGEQKTIAELRLIEQDLMDMPSAQEEAGEVSQLARDLISGKKTPVDALRLAQEIKMAARERIIQSL